MNKKFLQKIDIYWSMIIVLSLYAILSAIFTNFTLSFFGLQLLLTLVTAIALDVLIKFLRLKKFIFPKTAIISGLFIALLLTPTQNVFIPVIAAAIAIVSKNFLKIKGRTLLNPASLGLAVVALFLSGGISWWGTTPLGITRLWESGNYILSSSIIFTIAAGVLINYKFKRLHLVLSFLVSYFLIFLAFAFFTSKAFDLIIIPFLDPAILFFAFFMIVEPMSSPIFFKGRIIYGVLVALLSVLFLFVYPNAELLLALLAINVFVPLINRMTKPRDAFQISEVQQTK